MYKFIGGFLNTNKPYNLNPDVDDILYKKLIITQNYLDIINRLLLNFNELLQQHNEDLINKYLATTNSDGLLTNIIEDLVEINKYTNMQNISGFKNYIQFRKFISDTKIPELTKLKTKIEDLLKINCFFERQDCDLINKEEKNTNTQKINLLNNISEYIGNTFGLNNFAKILRKLQIKKYVLLQKFNDDEYYYIVLRNSTPDDPDCRFFLLNNNLSISEHDRDIIDRIKYNRYDQNIYFRNTHKYNLTRGKMFATNFIEAINTIKNLDLKVITDVFNILYRKHKETKLYMPDVINKYNNIVIFLAYINKIKVIYDAIDSNTPPTSESFADIQEHISYSYNFYLYQSELMTINENPAKFDETFHKLNEYLRQTRDEVYQKFIKNVVELYIILHNLKIACLDDGELVKDILSNFLNILFEINELSFPISKEKIVTTLTEIEPVKRNKSEDVDGSFLKSLSPDERIFNYSPEFKALKDYNVRYEGYSFQNCGENTLFNLINYLITHKYNSEKGEIIFDNNFINIDKVQKSTDLYGFYKEFKNFNSLISKYESDEQIRNKFAEIFSKKTSDKDVYIIKDVCEIRPNETNIIKLLNIVFDSNFENIADFITYFDKNHIVKIRGNEKILNNKYKISLTSEHGTFIPLQPLRENLKYKSLYDLLYEPVASKKLSYRNKLILYSKIINTDGINMIHHILKTDDLTNEEKVAIINDIEKDFLSKNINSTDENSNTPLHYAIQYSKDEKGLLKLVDELIKNGADINSKGTIGNTPLHYAINKKFIEIAENLIDKGVDVNIKNDLSNTPLYYAVKKKLLKIVNILLHKVPDVNIKDIYGKTVLHIAIEDNSSEIVDTLIKHKDVDINIKGYNGNTPLHYVVENENNLIKIVEKLIDANADLNIVNNSGDTPLGMAFNNKHYEIVEKLIDSRADVNIEIGSEKGKLPLLMGAIQNTPNLLKKILDKGAQVNTKNYYGDTPLHYAIRQDLFEIVEKLIEKGADINSKGRKGNTPIFTAIIKNLPKTVDTLIKHGALVTIQNEDRITPLDLAKEKNLLDIVKKIEEHMHVTSTITQVGGYHRKYLKYKQKYLRLKML